MNLDIYNVLAWVSSQFMDAANIEQERIQFGFDIDADGLSQAASPVYDFLLGQKRRHKVGSRANAYEFEWAVHVYHTTNDSRQHILFSELASHVRSTRNQITGLSLFTDNPYMIEEIMWVNTGFSDVLQPERGLPYQVAEVRFFMTTDSIPYDFEDPADAL